MLITAIIAVTKNKTYFYLIPFPGAERDDSKNEKCKCKLQLLSLNITAQLMFYFQLSRGAIIRAIDRTTFLVIKFCRQQHLFKRQATFQRDSYQTPRNAFCQSFTVITVNCIVFNKLPVNKDNCVILTARQCNPLKIELSNPVFKHLV